MVDSSAALFDAISLLGESERRLQLALSPARGIDIWDWNVPGDRAFADERFARLCGVESEMARSDAPIAGFFALIHAEDLPRVRARIDDALRTGNLFSEKCRPVRGGGQVTWVIAEGRCEIDSSGKPLRFSGVSFDITKRRLAQVWPRELNAPLGHFANPLPFVACRTQHVTNKRKDLSHLEAEVSQGAADLVLEATVAAVIHRGGVVTPTEVAQYRSVPAD